MPRRVLDEDGRLLRNGFYLLAFRDGDAERRRDYFRECDRILAQFRQGDTDPPDSFVVRMLALTVEEDKTFTSHVLGRNDPDPDLKALRLVCAGMFFEAYIRAVEDGAWPEN